MPQKGFLSKHVTKTCEHSYENLKYILQKLKTITKESWIILQKVQYNN